MKTIHYIILAGIFLITSCVSNKETIKKSCELNNHINDTISITGIYSVCMEYESFDLLIKDKCEKDFSMSIYFTTPKISKKLQNKLNRMSGCQKSMKMTLRGVLRKVKNREYGHEGSNTAEFEILEVINFGNVIYPDKQETINFGM